MSVNLITSEKDISLICSSPKSFINVTAIRHGRKSTSECILNWFHNSKIFNAFLSLKHSNRLFSEILKPIPEIFKRIKAWSIAGQPISTVFCYILFLVITWIYGAIFYRIGKFWKLAMLFYLDFLMELGWCNTSELLYDAIMMCFNII